MNPLKRESVQSASSRRSTIGRQIEILESTDSTNDRCHELADHSGADGLVIIAEHQTSGRGQRGRVWSAPRYSSLLFSVLLYPTNELAAAPFLTAWAASAVAEVLRERSLDARIKWPNDVLIEGRKICGILVEQRIATVVGIGLNVAVKPDEFPDDLRLPATSLEMETGQSIDRTELFNNLLDRLDSSYESAVLNGPNEIWWRWPALAENLIDAPVLITTASEQLIGRLVELRPDRGARVLLPSGTSRTILPEYLLRVERQPEPGT
jgi:BirA family biotin operon repressor/biotin-[acetyl-CoA-carboxylase] ligase